MFVKLLTETLKTIKVLSLVLIKKLRSVVLVLLVF